MMTFISESSLADITGTSFATVHKWGNKGVYHCVKNERGQNGFYMEKLCDIPAIKAMIPSALAGKMCILPQTLKRRMRPTCQ